MNSSAPTNLHQSRRFHPCSALRASHNQKILLQANAHQGPFERRRILFKMTFPEHPDCNASNRATCSHADKDEQNHSEIGLARSSQARNTSCLSIFAVASGALNMSSSLPGILRVLASMTQRFTCHRFRQSYAGLDNRTLIQIGKT